MQDRAEFVHKIGFAEDPFAQTNADLENRLLEYFVPPNYFAEAFGEPDQPKSFYVFAPRGGGKTAQRKMMERKCSELNVLCLPYVDFDSIEISKVADITLEHHLKRILTLGWLAILLSIDDDSQVLENLGSQSAAIAINRINEHVGSMSKPQFEAALHLLRSQNNRFKAFVEKHSVILRPVGQVVNAILKAAHRLDFSKLAQLVSQTSPDAYDAKYDLRLLISVAREIGYRSIYVLIDRVDESKLTGNNPERSFQLIEPMVSSLQLLETSGIAFKFFLWDAMMPDYLMVARRDRVFDRLMEWKREDLSEMLQKRLRTFSNGSFWNLDAVSENSDSYSADDLAVLFAGGSPRDLIRLCSKIISEQEVIDDSRTRIGWKAIFRGIDEFCKDKTANEIFKTDEQDLRRFQRIGAHAGHVDFTIPYVASEVLQEHPSGTGNRLRKWKAQGLVIQVGKIAGATKNKGKRIKLFVIEDVRLARHIVSEISTKDFIASKVKQCPNCSEYNIRDLDCDDSNGICTTCWYDWINGVQMQDFEIIDDEDEELEDSLQSPETAPGD